MKNKIINSLIWVFVLILAIPIAIVLISALPLLSGFLWFGAGYLLEFIAQPFIYGALDVIPGQPFSSGDFPKILAILGFVKTMWGNLKVGNNSDRVTSIKFGNNKK